MFEIDKKRKTLHITRGDVASFTVCLPIKDNVGHILYLDKEGNKYWYDEYDEILYNSDDEEVTGLSIDDLDVQLFMLQPGDVLRFKIIEAKNFNNIIKSKDFTVNELTAYVPIELTSEDTKIGEIIHKPVDYWYEIELNPDTNPRTVIGYDRKGKKLFKLYPEGADKK